MKKTSLAILATVLACATPVLATEDLGAGDGVLDLAVGYSQGGKDFSDHDADPALGVHYFHHLTPRFALGVGMESGAFGLERTILLGHTPHHHSEDVDVLSLGPFLRCVFNPGSRVRAYASGGVTYNRMTFTNTYEYTRFRVTEPRAGAVAASGVEMELARRILIGAEARFAYLDLRTEDGRYTQTTLALRMGYRF